jgi:hypothetical protein
MEDCYRLEAIQRVSIGDKVTILGRIETHGSDYIVLNDTSASIKVKNVPVDSVGMMEARGICRATGVLEATGFTAVRGEVDLSDHLKLVEVYRKIPLPS